MKIAKLKSRSDGFTIIELMIATSVLSIILLMVTVLMMNIGNLYFKGINQSRIQDNVRNLGDEISQQIQLGDNVLSASGDAADGNAGQNAFCIGLTRYTYIIGIQLTSQAPNNPPTGPAYPHVLWRDKNPSPGGCSITGSSKVNLTSSTPSADPNGTELIAPRSRLSSFSIVPSAGNTSPYALTIGEAYGDNDLLCSPSVANSCSSGTQMPNAADYTHGDLRCKGSLGDQFCATSSLSTSVVRRLK